MWIYRKRALLLPLVGAMANSASNPGSGQQVSWQADLQIKTLEVTRARTGISVRIVVYTEHDGEARLLVLLPVGTAGHRLAAGCSVGPSAVPSLRATVTCVLGSIADRGYHEVVLALSSPTAPARLGVFAYSGTPDPRPGNNYAERILP